ncbi:hypothetical protein OROMI_008412 [Orobanche minor]
MLGAQLKNLYLEEANKLIEIACGCIRKQLPSETMHEVLQICSTLTRNHSAAVSFLDAGGLHLILSLPACSLFAGFDSIVAVIIRHTLEDPQTLQQTMESEIRRSFLTGANRQSTPRLMAPGSAHGKLLDVNSKISKIHKKPPQSFVNVIDLLLDSMISFQPPVLENESLTKVGSSSTYMEIDVSASKDKGKSIATLTESNEANYQESSVSMVKIVFILKLLTEILLKYSSSIHILLWKDAEVCSSRGNGIFHHVLYKFIPYTKNHNKERKMEVDWRQKLASKANRFLVASCVRLTKARKRILSEIRNVFNDFIDPFNGFRVPRADIQSLTDLLNDVLSDRLPIGSYITAESSITFIEVVTGIVKVLESVTKEHILTFGSINGRGEQLIKPTDPSQPREVNAGGLRALEDTDNANVNSMQRDESEPAHTVTDYMEHDQDDGGFTAAVDDYMHDNAEGTQNLESGHDTMGIRFEIRSSVQGDLIEDEDDDEISGDEGDEVDDEDEDADDEHNDIEEDEAHHFPHLDTNQDDHDIDEDEFDEETMEEDEDEEDDEDGVIVRLGEGMNGVNVFDHIEVFGQDSISSETFHVMPVEIFGSRRQGRTTSIYNLLGRSGERAPLSQHPLLVEPHSLVNAGPSRP